jgi:hypothetical protein
MVTTSTSIEQLLATAVTAYGVVAALTVLLQARQMLARRASCEVSGRFFAAYAGGYALWLLYGLSVGNVPLIVVDTVGLLCGGLTLAVALSLRGSLIHPTTWTSCTVMPVSEERPKLVPTARTPSSGRSGTLAALALSPPQTAPWPLPRPASTAAGGGHWLGGFATESAHGWFAFASLSGRVMRALEELGWRRRSR